MKTIAIVKLTKALNQWAEVLFDSQIQTIRDRGCPEQIVWMLQGQKHSVLQKASEMSFAEGNIPFIPVIPRTHRSPYDLIAMVRIGNKKGYTSLDPLAITDEIETPKDPYYIYDVEEGQAFLGKNLKKAIDIIKKQSRSPLTAAEIMALATHTDVLLQHYLAATGSRYNRFPYGKIGEKVLVVSVDNDSRPTFDSEYLDHLDWHLGCPSCRR